MRLNIYAIYDTASGAYMRPFFVHSDGQAIRAFSDIATDANHDIGKHPEDYTLYRIGTYDDQNGKLHPEDPSSLATAMALVAASRNVNKGELLEFDEHVKQNTGKN